MTFTRIMYKGARAAFVYTQAGSMGVGLLAETNLQIMYLSRNPYTQVQAGCLQTFKVACIVAVN